MSDWKTIGTTLALFVCITCFSIQTVDAKTQQSFSGIEILGTKLQCPEVVLNALKKNTGSITQQQHRMRKNTAILENWLRSQGYMDAHVQCRDLSKNQYQIEEGQRWHIGSISIKPAIHHIQPDIPKVGAIFTTEFYEKGKKALQNVWVEQGYLMAKFTTAKVTPDKKNKTMHIIWEMGTGHKNRIAHIQVKGNNTYNIKDIIRLSGLKQGQFTTGQRLRDSAERISRDIRFRSATVFARTDQIHQNHVPLRITVVETPRFELLGNIGYSSDLGLSVQTGFKDFGLNQGRLNAHAQAEMSDVQQGAGLMIARPAWPDARDSTGIQGDFLKQDSAALRTSIWSAGIFLRREFSKYNFAKLSLNEKWIQSSDIPMKLFEPALDFRFDWRNQASSHLRDGWRVDARFALPIALQGQGKWLSAKIGGRFYLPIKKYLLFVPRLGYGITLAINGGVPKQLRQYLGGAGNVRGYKLDSVGFPDIDGLALGGRKSAYAGIDMVGLPERTVSPVIFADMGRVWDIRAREQPLAVSAGVGIIIKTDIGSIRVDMAMPLRRFGLNMGSRWYFSLGEVL